MRLRHDQHRQLPLLPPDINKGDLYRLLSDRRSYGFAEMTYTLEQQKEHRKLWVEALRSGEYEQAESELTNGRGYCCLGVACLVAGKSIDDIRHDVNLSNFPEVKSFFGIRDNNGDYSGNCLVDLNDEGTSFSYIAEIIEREPRGLFAESVEP